MERTRCQLAKANAVAVAALLLALVAGNEAAAEVARNNYYYPENWLCRPDRNEACKVDLTATVVRPNGKLTRQSFHPDPKAPIDCFYVYPTVSREPGPLSDMIAAPEEKELVAEQFAPFGAKCRLYAPLYRQITLPELEAEGRGKAPDFDTTIPARDVVNAWRSYLAHDNAGRGFVLIGHSQGAAILKYMVAALIDGTPLARQLVSIIVPGTDIDVPPGEDVGGTFSKIPLCHSADQTGCVIVYSSYLASEPPGEDANFGMGTRPGLRDGCVNPALHAIGATWLDAVLPASFGDMRTKFRTRFFEEPGLLSAACVSDATHSYLRISVAQDQRTPKVQRFLNYVDRNRSWGLHEMDINLALGDLITTVGTQSKAWLAHNGPAATPNRRDPSPQSGR